MDSYSLVILFYRKITHKDQRCMKKRKKQVKMLAYGLSLYSYIHAFNKYLLNAYCSL